MQPYLLPHMQFQVKSNKYGTAWGSRMTLFGDYAYNIRSNGKGPTPQLAILSSLAEFTERVQSFLPFPIANFLPRLMLKPDLDKDHPDFTRWLNFNQNLKEQTHNKTPHFRPFDTTFYKFYDVLEDQDIFLDQSFLISPSNGRAAGNTYEEAVVMAITEVFERYTTRMVLMNNKPLPTIPIELLSEPLQKHIKSITTDQFDVCIKDFSLGKGFPVVGMLFGNSEKGYVLKSSSDLSLNRAVSRCLSDFFQNFESVPHRLENAKKKSAQMIQYYKQFQDLLETEVTLEELKANRFSSDSVYSPMDLDFLVKDSQVEFTPWGYNHNDYYDELQEMIQFFRSKQLRLYVCDLGWLGFPTVMVYSPELQQYKFSIYDRVAFFDKRVFPGEKVRAFRKALLQDKESVFSPKILNILKDPTFLYLFIFKRPESVGVMRGLPHVGQKITNFNAWHFLGLLALYLKDIRLARRFFGCFKIDEPNNKYVNCALDYLSLLPQDSRENDGISRIILKNAQKNLTQHPIDVIDTMTDLLSSRTYMREILEELIVPCPFYETKCDACNHKNYCAYGKLSPILEKMVKNFPNKLYFFRDPVGSP